MSRPKTRRRRGLLPSSFRLRPSRKASSLITTLLVLVVLSTIVVAFMQSMSIERSVARSAANRERAVKAAEAGLEAALARLKAGVSTNFTVAQDRSPADPRDWPLILVQLNSDGIPTATNSTALIMPSFTNHTFAELTKRAPVHALTDSAGATNGSFSYVVLDNTSRQSLLRYPQISPRAYSTTIREIPLVQTNLATPSGQALDLLATNFPFTSTTNFTNYFLTIRSINQIFETNASPDINELWTITTTWLPAIAPDGNPKINLRRLKYYIDGLPVNQDTGNPKSQVVEAILGRPSNPANLSDQWGGGTLSWLISPSNPGRYTLTEARQIAANLIDYLDDDLHPTTDNADAPTYVGVEGRLLANGTVRGHPYVTAIGHGLVFNISRASGFNGWLNSTRVLTFWSLVNPWSAPITGFHSAYSVELDVEVLGNATGGNLGNLAQAYFLTSLNERLSEGPNSLPAYSGSTFPQNPSGMSFANFLSHQPANRQPPGIQFSNIQFRIAKGRLKFTDSDGLESYVQILDNLKSIPTDMNPSNFTLPTSAPPTSRVYNPGTVRNASFLATDPRLNFQALAWSKSQLTASEASNTEPPAGTAPANLFAAMDTQQGDGIQGVPTGKTWYTSTSLTNHLFVRSTQTITNNPATVPYNPYNPNDPKMIPPDDLAVDSIAELGYLGTGRPWQTLRMVEPSTNIFRRDYYLLDYVDAGTMPVSTNRSPIPGRPYVSGIVNIATAQRPAMAGVFTNIPGLASPLAAVDSVSSAGLASGYPFTRAGAVGGMTNLAMPGATNKFGREELMRRIANVLTVRAGSFLVVSHGEARDPRNPSRVIGRATAVGHVELVEDPPSSGNLIPTITHTSFQ
jgi:Tfp pilus assembly protein PilX